MSKPIIKKPVVEAVVRIVNTKKINLFVLGVNNSPWNIKATLNTKLHIGASAKIPLFRMILFPKKEVLCVSKYKL